MRDLAHLIDCGVDLVERGGLFVGRRGDLLDDCGDLADLGDDAPECLARLADEVDALFDQRGCVNVIA